MINNASSYFIIIIIFCFFFCFLFDDNRYTGNQTEFIMHNLTMGTTHYFQIAAAVRRQSLPDLIGPFSNISSCATSGTSYLHSLLPLLSSKIDTELTSFLLFKRTATIPSFEPPAARPRLSCTFVGYTE